MNRAGQTKRGRRAGFTMIEAIVVIVIIGVIAAMIAPRLIGRIGQGKRAVAQNDIATLFSQVQLYEADCGPLEAGSSLSVLMQRPSSVDEGKWHGPYLQNEEQLKDPWGNPYQLIVPGQVNADFDIVSYGADGQPGGEGDNKDIVSGKKD